MKIVHALEKIEPSIFLAGPTPRTYDAIPWRPKALEILEELNFEGTVYVPESPDWQLHGNYDDQVDWELKALNSSTVVAFWVPRCLVTMPAFTTNVEFGMFVNTGKTVFGCPQYSQKNKYLIHLCKQRGIEVHDDMTKLLASAIRMATELGK